MIFLILCFIFFLLYIYLILLFCVSFFDFFFYSYAYYKSRFFFFEKFSNLLFFFFSSVFSKKRYFFFTKNKMFYKRNYRFDHWRKFHISINFVKPILGSPRLYKFFLNLSPFKPRWNFYGLRTRVFNFIGRRWNFDCYFHVVRKYFHKKKKKRKYNLYYFHKRRYRFFFFFSLAYLKNEMLCVKRYFCFFFKYFVKFKTKYFFLRKQAGLYKIKNKNFFTFALLKNMIPKVSKKKIMRLLNIIAFEYHIINVQINFTIFAGVLLFVPSIVDLRIPNFIYRNFSFTTQHVFYFVS